MLFKIRELSLDVFHIAFLIRSFLIRDPLPHPVGWWSSIPLFLMLITYHNYLFFRGSTSSAYSCNLLFLSDVLLKIVKPYQPCNSWYIFWWQFHTGLPCHETSIKIFTILALWCSECSTSPPGWRFIFSACQSFYFLI